MSRYCGLSPHPACSTARPQLLPPNPVQAQHMGWARPPICGCEWAGTGSPKFPVLETTKMSKRRRKEEEEGGLKKKSKTESQCHDS